METADVHPNILHSDVERGTGLNRSDIAQQLIDLDGSIEVLKGKDRVVFDCNDDPVGTNPFTMEQREHEVFVNDHKVHCLCALDALAVSPMFDRDTTIKSKCHGSGKSVDIHQHHHRIIDADGDQDVFFGISWKAAAGFFTSLITRRAQ